MIWELIIVPLLLGLLGFIEPCSLGINGIFLARIQSLDKLTRIKETLLFTLVRALVLSLLGLTAAFVGKKLFTFQSYYFIILGIFYALMGFAYIYTKNKNMILPSLNFSKLANKNILSLGIIFGLVIPACAIPLLLVLIGKSLLLGDLLKGFISLFLFGVGLSTPLFLISFSEKSTKIIKWLSNKAIKTHYIAGVFLIILGVITALSSYWWIN